MALASYAISELTYCPHRAKAKGMPSSIPEQYIPALRRESALQTDRTGFEIAADQRRGENCSAAITTPMTECLLALRLSNCAFQSDFWLICPIYPNLRGTHRAMSLSGSAIPPMDRRPACGSAKRQGPLPAHYSPGRTFIGTAPVLLNLISPDCPRLAQGWRAPWGAASARRATDVNRHRWRAEAAPCKTFHGALLQRHRETNDCRPACASADTDAADRRLRRIRSRCAPVAVNGNTRNTVSPRTRCKLEDNGNIGTRSPRAGAEGPDALRPFHELDHLRSVHVLHRERMPARPRTTWASSITNTTTSIGRLVELMRGR